MQTSAWKMKWCESANEAFWNVQNLHKRNCTPYFCVLNSFCLINVLCLCKLRSPSYPPPGCVKSKKKLKPEQDGMSKSHVFYGEHAPARWSQKWMAASASRTSSWAIPSPVTLGWSNISPSSSPTGCFRGPARPQLNRRTARRCGLINCRRGRAWQSLAVNTLLAVAMAVL